MKAKILSLLAVILCFVSCQRDADDMNVVVGGEQEVMLTMSLPEATRADSEEGFDVANLGDDYKIRYILEIHYNDKVVRETKIEPSASATFSVRLAPTREYTFVAWADIVKEGVGPYYTIDLSEEGKGLSEIKLTNWENNANDEVRDAYTYKMTKEFYAGVDLSMPLTRPFAKIRVVSTDIANVRKFDIEPTGVEVTYLKPMYTTFNAVTGEKSDESEIKHVITYNNSNIYEDFTTNEATLFADYILVPEDGTVQFTMDVKATSGSIKESTFNTPIAVEVNKLTTIKGAVLTDGGDVKITVDNELGEKETINIVDTAEDLVEELDKLNDPEVDELNIQLGGDIDLNDLLGSGIMSTRATDYTKALEIPEGKSLVLDLKEYNLVYSTDVQNCAMIHNDGELTIKSTTGAVKYTYTGAADTTFAAGNYAINNAGTLTINGNVEIIAGDAGKKFSHALYAINNSGSMTMLGGKILNNTNVAIRQWVGSETKASEITMNGGEIKGSRGIWVQLPNSRTDVAPLCNITITDGIITGTAIDGTQDSGNVLAIYSYSYGNQMKNVKFNISGGTFNGDIALTGGRSNARVDAEEITITGGTFNGVWGDVYSYADEKLAAEAITIKGGSFSSLSPIVYLADGCTFTLNSDVENAEPVQFTGKGTLNLNGKTVSSIDSTKANYAIITNKGELKITNGTMTLESTEDTGWSRFSSVISNGVGGKLTVENDVTIKHLGGTSMSYGIDNLTNGKGTSAITIVNGATVESAYIAIRQFLNGVEATNELTITAGSKVDGKYGVYFQDPTVQANSGKITINEGANVKSVYFGVTAGSTEWPVEVSIAASALTDTTEKAGIYSDELPAGYALVKENGVWTVSYTCAAKIGDEEYGSLNAAVAAVKDGDTIILVRDETFTEKNRTFNSGTWYDGMYYVGDKSFTIDLNGKTINQDGAVNDYLLNFKNVGTKANTITLKNGTVDAGTAAYCALCTSGSGDNNLTINTENIHFINNNSYGSTLKIRCGLTTLNIKAGTKITGQDSYLGIESSAATINIYDGAEIYMNGTSSYNGCLVGVGGNGEVNVYGGYGKGAHGGFIAMTSGGVINVSGGEWIANTDGTIGNNSNLNVLTAQSNSNEQGFKGGSYINVSGGTFRGGMDAWILNNDPSEDAGLNIKGGNFNADPAVYLAEGYKAVESNGVWSVVKE